MSIGRPEIDLLRHAGLLPASRYARAMVLVRDDRFWSRWARHALLALGIGHLLGGIIFFFAYNWADLPDLAKFAVVEAGILLSAAGAIWRGLDRPEGAAALIAATVLTGVLLAVIGQVYQSGADPWQLFALWAGLALPWALASRSASHWLVWLVVLHVAAVLFRDQLLVPSGMLGELPSLLLLGLLPVLVLAAREAVVAQGGAWADDGWTRLVPALAAAIGLGLGAASYLLDLEPEALPNTAAFLVFLAAIALVYRRTLPDLAMLAVAVGFFGLFLIGVGARILDFFDFNEGVHLLPLGLLILWVVGVVAGAAKLLAYLRRSLAPAPDAAE